VNFSQIMRKSTPGLDVKAIPPILAHHKVGHGRDERLESGTCNSRNSILIQNSSSIARAIYQYSATVRTEPDIWLGGGQT